jgi:uncharacterized membrane protein
MRAKYTNQEAFEYYPQSSVKIVQKHVEKYRRLDEILQSNRTIFEVVHQDFEKYLSNSSKGRTADYTSEQIFRALLVIFMEQWSYRKTVVNIDTNLLLQKFVGLGFLPMMDYTFLNKAYCALSEESLLKINRILSEYAKEENQITGEQLRLDSTVYETNIQYPSDSSLLWDSYRTLARLMTILRREMRKVGLIHRFHTKEVKKLSSFISRNGSSKRKSTQRTVKSVYRELIDRVRGIWTVGQKTVQNLENKSR